MNKKKRVLVTGVAGFIGSNLSRMLLEEGYEVVGIDNLSAGTMENLPAGVEFHKSDIRYPYSIVPAFRDVETVFHLAAKNCLIECLDNPEETVATNVHGTVNILETCRHHGVRRLIYADTSAEYEGVDQFPSKEDSVCPVGTYAVSKRSGWLFCDSYARLHGLELTTLRYFNVYGPAQDFRRVVPPVMSAFIMKLLSGEDPVIYGSGEKRRDFVYVDDVNRFHLLCLKDRRAIGGVFNIGSGSNHSVNEVFTRIESLLQTGRQPVRRPDLPGEAEITLADISAANALGWRPQIDLDTGLRYSIAYLKKRLGIQGEDRVKYAEDRNAACGG